MSHVLEDLKAFLEDAPTSWHAVKEIANRLSLKEFQLLEEEDAWKLESGGKYFVIRDGTLVAFCLPKKKPTSSLLFATHTDSPALKLKPDPIFETQNMVLLKTELYGAPLLSSWLNRDLSISGRVAILHKGETEVKLISLDDIPVFIPQLAIHLDREVNEKGLTLNKQDHLNAILGLALQESPPPLSLEELLKRYIPFDKLLGHDLFLTPLESVRFVGWNTDCIAAYRLDNLLSAHAALSALCHKEEPLNERLLVSAFFDHEEIGSGTKEGAHSCFLDDLLKRITHCLKLSTEDFMRFKSKSLCLSIDATHASNPNYLNKQDDKHAPLLGKGVVVKYSAAHKYASDVHSATSFRAACEAQGFSYQLYTPRSDLPFGSTTGPLIAKSTAIPTLDIGCPLLSMHSAREVVSSNDYLEMIKILCHLSNEG